MPLKIGILIAVIVIGLGVGFKVTQNKSSQWRSQNTVEAASQRARHEGKTRTVIPSPRVDYAGANVSFDEALQNYSVVIAEPLGSVTYLRDENHIVTWWRFSIKEVLSAKPPFDCDTCPKPSQRPTDFAAPKDDELLIAKLGGTITMNGVEVTMSPDIPDFNLNQSYLMFVNRTSSGVAILAGGPTGIFEVGNQGQLKHFGRQDAQLRADVQDRFGLNIARLKSHFNR
jgi:hypothetical protein